MDKWAPSWRGSPFQVGHRYKALLAARTWDPEGLVAGEEVVYQRSGYSRYDNCSIYCFVNDTGALRTWWLHDDEPLDSWRQVFTAV
jgi:hypothetical protein